MIIAKKTEAEKELKLLDMKRAEVI